MAFPNSNPFYGSTGGGIPANGGQQRLALDNLLRRELKIGDPNDPAQVAQALLSKYQSDPKANAIAQEAKGLPFLLAPTSAPAVMQLPTSTSAEFQQAKDDVERDLQELLTDAMLKDVTPEIQGWAQAVRSAIQEGAVAARFALDPNQRDKAFALRRQLGDYARMARLVGALTPSMNMYYRKFAQSLDEVAAVLLVLMGEALSNVGFNGGRFLLQAPYTELQVRRDAVIYAMRNLVGATQQAYGPNDWPRGLDAYRTLFRILEEQGQSDLRSLLSEVELARVMDELIQRSAHGNAEGLRALGSTALLDLERFRRLVYVGQFAVSPESPPLSAFLEALQLFADAFKPSGGFRLMRVSRPPILFYGLYGNTGMDDSDRRLLQIIINRGLLADQLDCFMRCACGDDAVKCQVVLDKVHYDVDRAIDLYAMGQYDFGQPERRAAAYSYLIEQFLEDEKKAQPNSNNVLGCGVFKLVQDNGQQVPVLVDKEKGLGKVLGDIVINLRPSLDGGNDEVQKAIRDIKDRASTIKIILGTKDLQGKDLCKVSVKDVGPCKYPNPNPDLDLCTTISDQFDNLTNSNDFASLLTLYKTLQVAQSWLMQNGVSVELPDSTKNFLGILHQELSVQKDMESRWESLVRTMAPDCVGISDVLNRISEVINGAMNRVGCAEFKEFKPSIPPHFETSLDSIVDDVDRMGRGRPTL